jgi:SMI1 / KNR4 family (SUKH-1)
MLAGFDDLGSKFHRTGRVEAVQAFDPVEAAIGLPLPADYKAFLMWADGGETMPPLEHITFYPLEELVPRRSDGQPPGSLEFATDDSDGYAFDLRVGRRSASYPVVSYPLGDTTREDLEFVAEGFRKFLEILQDPAARYR